MTGAAARLSVSTGLRQTPIDQVLKAFFYLIVLAGAGNTILRPEVENPYTLYRLLAPAGLIAMWALRPNTVHKYLGWFAVFFLYNLVLASAYSSDYSQFFPSIVHYLYLYVLLMLMLDMKWRFPDFDEQFMRFVQGFYAFLLANMALEFFIGPYFPNLAEDDTGESILRTFYWSQNDLSVVLGVIAWFALALDRFKGWKRVAIVLFTIWAEYYNDSKAALLSMLMFSLPILLIFRICSSTRISRRVWYFVFGVLATIAVAVLVAVSDVEIQFANDIYTVGDMLVQPITNIVALQASGEEWGSINNRTDAAIFVIIEYLKSYGFGLGAGGSWLVLALPQYELGGAKSPHNAFLQFTVDFGYPVLLGYLYLAWWALRKLFTYRLNENDRLRVMAILSFPMLGISQSGAIVTNYFFFAAVFYICLRGRHLKSRSTTAAPRSRRFLPSSGLSNPLPAGTS